MCRRWSAESRVLLAGDASGAALVLDEPLSFWGGVEPTTGQIIDHRHPQHGLNVAGRVLVMSAGRGSSSSSTVLAECLRAGTGPAAIVLLEADEILVVGGLVARMLDGTQMPIVVLDSSAHARISTGSVVAITERRSRRRTQIRESGINEATPPKRGRCTVPADPTTEAAGLLPRHKGIYHAGCTGYPNPTYP